jgi:hypothetical protein
MHRYQRSPPNRTLHFRKAGAYSDRHITPFPHRLIHRCQCGPLRCCLHPRSLSPYPPLLTRSCGSYLTYGMDAMAMQGLTAGPIITLLVCNRVSMLSYEENLEGELDNMTSFLYMPF